MRRQTTTESGPVLFVSVIVVPAVFGALVGLVLGWSATAYWVLQAVAALGGVLGGIERGSAGQAADRGLLGGLLFGSFLLLAHAISGDDAKVSLGEWPGVLVVLTGIGGTVLAAAGGALGAFMRGRRPSLPTEPAPDAVDHVRA